MSRRFRERPRSRLTIHSPAAIVRIGLTILPILLSLLGPGLARADATPVHVVLTYLDGVSNWGPRQVSGVAEIVREEGEVRLSARGLAPTPNLHYVFWLGRDGSTDTFRVGELGFAADGTATLDLLLADAIPDRGWNLAFVTAEDSATPDHPGARRTLAGRYPKASPDGTLPYGLPDTGMADDPAPPSLLDDVISFVEGIICSVA